MSSRDLTPDMARRLTLDAEPWLSCDDCFAMLDEHVERLLADPSYDYPAMRAHLRGCGACAEEAASLLEMVAADLDLDAGAARQRLQS
jgi:hypothetical protein